MQKKVSQTVAQTTLGKIRISATPRGVCSLIFTGAASATPRQTSPRQLKQWTAALNNYLRGRRSRLAKLPLDIQGTPFQMRVWRYLQTIPSGEVRTYSQVAKAIGKPAAVRAVASACARNRVAIAIPCHRVIRGDGSLAGYRWGIERKRALLELEKKGA